jgi:N-acetylmuramoyl-L-alanine amidase
LKAPDVPSVLIELGFLSNRDDEALLARAGHRERLAATIAETIDAYFHDVELASLP